MATHSSILAWEIPWTEELGGLQSTGHKQLDSTEQLTFSFRLVAHTYRCVHDQFSSVTQLCLILWPHGLQHARPPCLSPTPRVYANSYPLSRWCHPAISSSVIPFSSCLQSFPASGSFQMSQSALCIRWPKYWSFSFNISPSNEHSGLISFRDGLVGSPCSPKDPQESSPTPQFKSINSSVLSFL